MRGQIDQTFELSLAISLKMMPRHLVRAAGAAKLPHEADDAFSALASGIVEQLRLSGWNITAPPQPLPDKGL